MSAGRAIVRGLFASLRASASSGAVTATAAATSRPGFASLASTKTSHLSRNLLVGAGLVAGCTATWSLAESSAVNPYKLPGPDEVRGSLPQRLTLYQYEVCPFCCKVKAFLDYHKIPYTCVEVNPLTKAELKWSEYRKVPVVVLDDGDQVNDSTAICSRLQAEIDAQQQQQGGAFSKGGSALLWLRSLASGGGGGAAAGGERAAEEAATEEEERWRRWVDERLVRVLTVNIYRTAGESWQTFDYITTNGNFGWASRQASRVAGSAMMYAISGRLQKKYGIQGDLRQQLYDSADEWVEALGDRPFMGGAKPNLADLAVFGVTRAVVGTDTYRDLMLHSRIAPWYGRMKAAVGDSARLPDGSGGAQEEAGPAAVAPGA